LHAREWLTGAVAMYLIDRLLSTEQGRKLLSRFQFIFIPVANPDGYTYTWSEDLFWRKNRRPNYQFLHKLFGGLKWIETRLPCGVDLNRNYANHWCEAGGSQNPTSDIYCGPREGSEVEIQALQNTFKETMKENVILGVLDVHAYGQLIMYPYGWCDKPCPHKTFMKSAVEHMTVAIKKTTSASYDTMDTFHLYPNSGTSTDWYYETACQSGMPLYSLAMELRPDHSTLVGFSVDPNEIPKAGEDLWNALQNFAYFAYNNPLS
jgi:hypothetical protein